MSPGQADKDARLIAAYEAAVGHPVRNLPEDHPDLWQWLYRGSKAEREKALELLGLLDDDVPVVIEGQQELL